MTNGAYSFIDVAVLDGVRGHFAAGDPLVLLSSDLNTLLWVNGAGAALMGYDDIETAMGTPFDLGINVRRQIGATRGFPFLETASPVTIRLQSGLNSKPLSCMASSISLPDGATGILLTVPGTVPAGLDSARLAARAIAGINAKGHFAALIGPDGEVIAASKGFSELGIAPATFRGMVSRVDHESDRLVKRMVPAGDGEIAAGMGRLVDDPALHLLIAVDEAAFEAASAKREAGRAAERQRQDELPAHEEHLPGPAANPAAEIESGKHAGLPEGRETKPHAGYADLAPPGQSGTPKPPQPGRSASDDQKFVAPAKADNAAPSALSGADAVRFVWRTDPQGRFSEISAEFCAAVGTPMQDIVGHSFAEVAKRHGIDRDGEIAGLLARRDTWSGRSVLWPLDGAGKRAPVDLAALPAYSRDRVFEGFRGFGVIRLSEAVAGDMHETGASADQALTESAPTSEPRGQLSGEVSGIESSPRHDDPFLGEKPAIEMAPTPERRDSDKVIRLAAHRERQAGGRLSETEESAFREIGQRLKEDQEPSGENPPAAGKPENRMAETAAADDAASEPAEPAEGAERQVAPADDGAEKTRAVKPANDAGKPEFATHGFLPSAFAGRTDWPQGGSDISILEQLPVAVLVRSGDTLHYANPEFLKLTGYASIEELAHAGGFDVLFAGPDGLADESDESARPAMRLVTREGAEKLCEAYLRSVRWEDHRALMLAIRPSPFLSPPMAGPDTRHEDLSGRVEELSAILDTATDGVVLLTGGGVIRSLNRSAEALFGFESDELAGKPFTSLFAVESQKSASDYLAGLSGPGVASVLNDGREVIGREAQGRFIPLFMTMGRLPEDRGYCAVMRDITQWKRAEEQLTQARGQAEKASSLKTEFLARISHEVRTPLNAIIGFSELMMDEKFGPIGNERYRDYLRDINRSGNHVLDLVNDLLDISKIEAGEQEMDFESVSLNDALADTVAMMQPDANRERVIIRSSFASNLPDVVADLRSIKQIALNLLSNAIRFTPAGGQVIVSTAYDLSGDVIMRVRDTGIGMTRNEVEQALRPFKQITSLKKRRNDGTGLGLPLTKAMVEANRAAFSIESKPDEGTIVEIVFPSTRVLAD